MRVFLLLGLGGIKDVSWLWLFQQSRINLIALKVLELNGERVLTVKQVLKSEGDSDSAMRTVEFEGVHEYVEKYLIEDFPICCGPFWYFFDLFYLDILVYPFIKLLNRLDEVKYVGLDVDLMSEHENMLVSDNLVLGDL